MQIEESVYLGRDNTIVVSLISNGEAIIHNMLNRVQALVGTTLIDSSVSPDLFDLTNADRMILKFGQAGLLVGTYTCRLVVYDNANENGLVWGNFAIVVK